MKRPNGNEIYTDDGTRIRAANSTVICDTSRGEFDDQEAEVWASKITRSVNCHDRLVEKLQDAIDAIRYVGYDCEGNPFEREWLFGLRKEARV